MNTYVVMPSETHVDLVDFNEHDIAWNDIAVALSRTKRFKGAGFSVLEHSLLVAEMASIDGDARSVLAHLVHDVAEAYIGDIISPVKAAVPAISELENRILSIVHKSLGLGAVDTSQLDRVALAYEYTQVFNSTLKESEKALCLYNDDVYAADLSKAEKAHKVVLLMFPTVEAQIAEFYRLVHELKREL